MFPCHNDQTGAHVHAMIQFERSMTCVCHITLLKNGRDPDLKRQLPFGSNFDQHCGIIHNIDKLIYEKRKTPVCWSHRRFSLVEGYVQLTVGRTASEVDPERRVRQVSLVVLS